MAPAAFLHLLSILALLLASALGAPTVLPSSCEPRLFVFGASMVDVGENAVAMPYRSNAEFPPYGMDYFSKPAGRWSNGRVFMDLISQELGYGLLDPFLKSVGANFSHGVNFASSGSTAQNSTLTGVGNDSSGLFSLMVQVDQFREYRSEVESQHQGSLQGLQIRQQLSESIYFIETAHNDYLHVAFKTPDFDPLATVIATVSAIDEALRALYNLGARNIIVMNVTPIGCAPSVLSNPYRTTERDKYGCKVAYIDLVNLHNQHLEALLDKLRVQLPMANWILFDAHTILLDGYHNPSKYGIKYPFQACCGAGGKYNFKKEIDCGKSGYIDGVYVEAKRCKNPSLHIIWDSIHPVESFCHHIAQGVLSGDYLNPKFNIKESCNPSEVKKVTTF